MRAYDILEARIRPGWLMAQASSLKIEGDSVRGVLASSAPDPSKWKYPPHVALANLGYVPGSRTLDTPEGDVRNFVLEYGPPTLGALGPPMAKPKDSFNFSLSLFRHLQGFLRLAWEKPDAKIFTDPGKFNEKVLGYDSLPANFEAGRDGLELRVMGCLAYMGILLARDIATRHAKVCKNREGDTPCKKPYFNNSRTDAMYCSHEHASYAKQVEHRKRQRRMNEK